MRLICFGLPLAALLLAGDGHAVRLAVLPAVEAPGRRRLRRVLGDRRVIDLGGSGTGFEALVDAALARERPELITSWFWTRRLPASWLSAATHGAIGVHPSLLPRHRGPDPYFRAIDSGDRETGVTLHRLDAEYDTGDILATRRLAIGLRDSWQLARALDRPSLELLRDGVRGLASGARPAGTPQWEELATWAPAPTAEDLRVDWRWPTERVLRRIRALAPVPGLALEIAGTALFVTRAEPAPEVLAALRPGEAAVVGAPARLSVRTGDGAIALLSAVTAGDLERPFDAGDLARLIAIPGRVVIE